MLSLYWRIVASKIESIQTRVMCIIFHTWMHLQYNEVLSALSLTTLMRDESTFVRLRLQDYRTKTTRYKQLLDEVFVIPGIIKVSVSVISLSLRLRLITLTSTLIIPDITKTESNNCFIIHCFEENNDKRIIAAITVYFQTLKNVQLSDKQMFTIFIKEIMHCARNLQIIH